MKIMDFTSAFNEVLKFFIENGTKFCAIDKINIPGLNGNQILDIVEKVPTFFRLIKACAKYNLSIHCNHDQCQELHICKQKFLNSKCTNDSCKLNHTLRYFQTRKNLTNLNINGDFDIILKFFQVFSNNEEEDDTKSSFSQNTVKSFSFRDKIEIQIRLPKNFIDQGSRKLLNEIFSDSSKSGGGPTVKCKYLPNKWKAYIVFEDDSVAENLIRIKEVKYKNYRFAISKAGYDSEKNIEFINKTNLNTDSENMNKNPLLNDSTNYNILLIKNVPNDKNKTDILRYAAIIARIAPSSANLIDTEKGIWKVQFDKNLVNTFQFSKKKHNTRQDQIKAIIEQNWKEILI
ncbi:hypothetical protein BpHYR1_048096 [Brachionus plicatilis]|uniref:C3H1-type domain-containing protein n=1 Tax=Brachionus plicatilis TaxID=10195 RepID=A0A3M7S9K3_BRAPC|nr:hypothetical protein BpHYR1_048096 [Brachionus plicatilis]